MFFKIIIYIVFLLRKDQTKEELICAIRLLGPASVIRASIKLPIEAFVVTATGKSQGERPII